MNRLSFQIDGVRHRGDPIPPVITQSADETMVQPESLRVLLGRAAIEPESLTDEDAIVLGMFEPGQYVSSREADI